MKTMEIRTHTNLAQKAYIIYYSEVTKFYKSAFRNHPKWSNYIKNVYMDIIYQYKSHDSKSNVQ